MNRQIQWILGTIVLSAINAGTVVADDRTPEAADESGISVDLDIDVDALSGTDLGDFILEIVGERPDSARLLREILPRVLKRTEHQRIAVDHEDILVTVLSVEEDDEEGIETEEEQEEVRRSTNYLGLSTRPIPESLAAQLAGHLDAGRGLVVVHVQPDSPAEKAGVQRHDVLVSFDGAVLESPSQLRKLIVESEPGSSVEFELVRAAESKTIEVKLGERSVSRQDLRRSIILNLPEKGVRVRVPRQQELERLKRLPGISNLKREELRLRSEARKLRAEVRKRLPNRTISITTKDGKRYKVEIKLNRKDDAQEFELEGTLEEIREQARKLPEEVRDELQDNLEELNEQGTHEEEEASSFQFQLQPRLADEGRSFRITIQRADEEGGTRLFELDQTIVLPEEEIEDYLLELQDLREELEDLAPTIRARVEETIRSIRIPKIEVEVEEAS